MTTKKIGKFVNERKVGDRLILDKIIDYPSIKEYISLWEVLEQHLWWKYSIK
jgi:hypothetical protein